MVQVSPDVNLSCPILVALGANLTSDRWGPPAAALNAAIGILRDHGLTMIKRSRWFESAPVPISDQPWYVNGVITVASTLTADSILAQLHEIEAEFGRVRQVRNEARVLDLDLIAYHDLVIERPGGIMVPHPRLAERAFVLLPIADVAPDWRHPATGRSVAEMIALLPASSLSTQSIRPIA